MNNLREEGGHSCAERFSRGGGVKLATKRQREPTED
jgi:hypothetical protein